jgi:predicted RNA binding protein YcfA (HicA-like mRNA interferase family)
MGLCLPRRKIIAFLESNGFTFVRSSGTSHHIYSNGAFSVPIPVHGKSDLGETLILRILKETELTKQELEKWLGRK